MRKNILRALTSLSCMLLPVASMAQVAPQSGDKPAQQENAPPKNDRELAERLLKQGTPEAKNMANLIIFIDTESSASGSIRACDVRMAEMYRQCSTEILNNWKSVTGFDIPDVHTPDKTSSAVIGDMWRANEEAAAGVAAQHPGDCQSTILKGQNASIWKYCSHPDWSTLESSPPVEQPVVPNGDSSLPNSIENLQ